VLARDITAPDAADDATRRSSRLLQKIQATARIGGWEVDLRKNELFWTDETYRIHEVDIGFVPDVPGAINFYASEAVPVITAAVEQCMKGIPYDVQLQLVTAKNRRIWVRAAGQPVFEDGKVVAIYGCFQEIDDIKRREHELEEKIAIIEAQRSAIHSMSAPIIQVWDGVLALPIVGSLDESRAADITERLLDAVVVSAATHAIIDLTAVERVDEATADHLLRIIRATQLLGARCIITGIRPAVAQIFVSLSANLSDSITLSNLREAIKLCMRGSKR
jgi:rsbT co-antagonist protein RsbR